MIRVKPGSPVSRKDLAVALDEAKIGNRMLFGGNLVRQPVFANARKTSSLPMRIIGNLAGADTIMNDALFVGVYPGLTSSMCEYIAKSVRDLFALRVESRGVAGAP
jgi:CDP-6-deoxy-D-xylo-4-hexulose-3-dehydrase